MLRWGVKQSEVKLRDSRGIYTQLTLQISVSDTLPLDFDKAKDRIYSHTSCCLMMDSFRFQFIDVEDLSGGYLVYPSDLSSIEAPDVNARKKKSC
jgi:hypothetical protein